MADLVRRAWAPPAELLDDVAALVNEAHRRGEWTPGREG